MVRSYHTNRDLVYDTAGGRCTKNIPARAAESSILGPDLRNMSYDGMPQWSWPQDAYPDDIAARED